MNGLFSAIIRFKPQDPPPSGPQGGDRPWVVRFPNLVKFAAILMLVTSLVSLLIFVVFVEILFREDPGGMGVEYFFWDVVRPAVFYLVAACLGFYGSRRLLRYDDVAMGLGIGVVLMFAIVTVVEYADILMLPLPGGECGASYFVLFLSILTVSILLFVRWRRKRVQERTLTTTPPDDGYGRR